MSTLPAASERSRPMAGGPRKALHLATRSPIRVSAAGESLAVRREPAGSRLFPVARINRVICNCNAQWSGDAILLCLAHGITLTWVDGRGRAVGDATAVRAPAVALADRLECYLEQPGWPLCYANWLRRRRMVVLHRWAEQQSAAGHPPDRGRFESLKRTYVYNEQAAAPVDDQGAGWCQALSVNRLSREGLHKRYWGYGGRALELCDDLAGLLWAEFSLGCGTLPSAAEVPAVRLLFFERWSHPGERSLLDHLADLHRHVAREIR